MIFRNGFVSNSSSSSFILTSNEKITSKEQLEKLLGECNVYKYSSNEVLEYLFNEIKNQNEDYNKMSDLKKLLYVNNIRYAEDLYQILIDDKSDDMSENERFSLDNLLENDECNITIDEFKDRINNSLDKFKEEFKENKMVYNFSFCDEFGGIEASLVSGEIFRNIDEVTQTKFR